MSLIDTIRQQLGPNELQQISQQLGIDQATAEQAVNNALPSMVAGMAGNAQDPDGNTQIQSAMGGQLGGLLGGILGGAGSAGAAGGPDLGSILGSILGRNDKDVEQDVQQKSGLDSAKTRQLLMMLAPIVLAALAKRRSQATQEKPLPDVLRKEAERANPEPGMGGILGKILAQVQEPRA